jgi:hypothetical protein
MLSNDFIVGFLAGVCVMVIFYWLSRLYFGWMQSIRAVNRPQIVLHTSTRTPAQVLESAARAQLKLIIFVIVVVVIIGVGIGVIFPSIGQFMYESLVNLVSMFTG